MKLLSSKEKITIAIIAFVLLLYLGLMQFYFLSPLKTDQKEKQQALQTEQRLLATLQKKSTNNDDASENTTELQKEIPVKPLQDQFILDLQQAEAVSNSQIKSMSFTEGGQAAATNTQTASTSNTSQTQSNTSTSSQMNTTNNTASQQQTTQTANTTAGQQNTKAAQTPGTPALDKLTVQLSIESPKYEDLEKFIETLESLKRIMVIETINYTGSKEITSLSQNNNPLDYTLTISAYYLPGLTDLDKQLPKADFPAPANKDNPLSQFASTDPQTP
jgi:type IV pilus assembly protein PilO